MILKGSQRGGAKQLALHLMNDHDNDHIEVHAIEGFVSSDVDGALQEIYAISRATKCKQFIFSLSLSPPKDTIVTVEDYEAAINESAERLGLADQPKVILFHEKYGRRHCHVVFSRIDTQVMKAINLPFFKDRLNELSHELFLTHGWEVPEGFKDKKHSRPLNYDLTCYHEAKKAKRKPEAIKVLLLECWQQSDDCGSFEAALSEKGFVLCRGDRRGFLAVDKDGKLYSLSRWLDVKPKVLRAVLGDPEHLPNLDEVREALTQSQNEHDNAVFDHAYNHEYNYHASQDHEHGNNCSHDFNASANSEPKSVNATDAEYDQKLAILQRERERLIARQRQEREILQATLAKRQHEKAMLRQQSLRKGLSGLWDRVTGTRVKQLSAIRAELEADKVSYNLEKLKLSSRHLGEARVLQSRIDTLTAKHEAERQLQHGKTAAHVIAASRLTFRDKALAERIRREPVHLLSVLIDKESVFTKADIARSLNKFIHDPQDYQNALAGILSSDELVPLEHDSNTNANKDTNSTTAASTNRNEPLYSTRTMIELETTLMNKAGQMAMAGGFAVDDKKVNQAIASEDDKLQAEVGVNLSEEQQTGIRHVTSNQQLVCVVGVAGAGKSTMLAASREAWEQSGHRVLGAALAGKAAKGLEQASGIKSKTIASLELSWRNDLHHLQQDDILVVDEAGMIGSRQMASLVNEVQERGAKLVLVGDPEQLQPINAGSPFRAIVEQNDCVRLDQVHRQSDEWQRKASQALANGRTHEALAVYDEHGAIQFMDKADEALNALVYDYMEDVITHGDQNSRLALAHRRDDVMEINDTIRDMRKATGDLEGERVFITAQGTRNFAVGDRLLFTRNDKDLGVKNGMLGTVTKRTSWQLSVELDDASNQQKPRIVTFSIQDYNDIDHGYATTIHKSQGATVDKSFILASRSMDRNLTYVAMTRHKNQVRFYAGKDEFLTEQKLYAAMSRKQSKRSSLEFTEATGTAKQETPILELEPEHG